AEDGIRDFHVTGVQTCALPISGVSPRSGDVERELNYQWTAEGLERLYIRSHVVLAAKAAKVQPIGGLWQDIKDLEGLRKAAQFKIGRASCRERVSNAVGARAGK